MTRAPTRPVADGRRTAGEQAVRVTDADVAEKLGKRAASVHGRNPVFHARSKDMADVIIRPYRPAEEERALEALMRGLGADAANIRRTQEAHLARTLAFLRTAREDRALCVVAEAEAGALVGYALLIPFWSGEYGGELILLDELYVTRERRSRGLGARLIEWTEAHARRTGRVGITFGVVGQNARAMRFYERLGYERLDLITFDKLL